MKILSRVLVPCPQQCPAGTARAGCHAGGTASLSAAVALCWHFSARGNPEPAVVSLYYHQQHPPLPSASPTSSWSFLGTQYPSARSYRGLLPVDVTCPLPLDTGRSGWFPVALSYSVHYSKDVCSPLSQILSFPVRRNTLHFTIPATETAMWL